MVAVNVGGNKDNELQWRDVYRFKKGSNMVCLGNPDTVIGAVDCLTISEIPEN